MDGLQEGAGFGEKGAAQGGPQQQAAQAQQVAGIGGDGATVVDDENVSARADYEAALAERDARIAELEGQIAEAAKTAESAEKLRAEMDELRRQGEEQRVSFELAMAGARNVNESPPFPLTHRVPFRHDLRNGERRRAWDIRRLSTPPSSSSRR